MHAKRLIYARALKNGCHITTGILYRVGGCERQLLFNLTTQAASGIVCQVGWPKGYPLSLDSTDLRTRRVAMAAEKLARHYGARVMVFKGEGIGSDMVSSGNVWK